MLTSALLVGLLAAANAALIHWLVHSYLAARVTERLEELRTGRPARHAPRVPARLTNVQPRGEQVTDPAAWPGIYRDAETMTQTHRWLCTKAYTAEKARDCTLDHYLMLRSNL